MAKSKICIYVHIVVMYVIDSVSSFTFIYLGIKIVWAYYPNYSTNSYQFLRS